MKQYELDNELQSVRMEEQAAILGIQKKKVELIEQLSIELDEEDRQCFERKNDIKFDIATVDSQYVCTTDIEKKSKLKFKQCTKRIELNNLNELHVKATRTIINKYKTATLKLDNECSELHDNYNKRRLELRKQFADEQKVNNPLLETANWDGEARIIEK